MMSEAQISEQELNNLLLKATLEGIIGLDFRGCIIFANVSARKMLGYTQSELTGKPMHDLLHHSYANGSPYPKEHCPVCATCKKGAAVRVVDEVLWCKHGRALKVECATTAIEQNGNVIGTLITFQDMTAQKAATEKLEYIAHHDDLTRLYNRAYFDVVLQESVSKAKKNRAIFALFYLDLDNFKNINDNLSHDMGDLLLKQVANRLRGMMRAYELIARLGGDEFAIIAMGINDVFEAGKIAQSVIADISRPYFISEQEIKISVSIGIACYPFSGRDASNLTRHADIALYRSKKNGPGNYEFYTKDLNKKHNRQLAIEASIENVTHSQELALLYQPQYNLKTNVLTGVEVLLRWHHPELGLILPGEFIHIAETVNKMDEIGLWVIEQACRQYEKWEKEYGLSVPIAINLSPVQMRSTKHIIVLKGAILNSAIPLEKIELELTESVVMPESDDILVLLKQLRDLGLSIAIDDFGTGYSSLARLKELPISTLKIDSAFVRDIEVDPKSAMIIKSIISLGNNLGLSVVAEGIENNTQRTFLIENGCEIGQGYLLGKPMSAEAFSELIK